MVVPFLAPTSASRYREHELAILSSFPSLVLVLHKYDGIYLQFHHLHLARYRDRDTVHLFFFALRLCPYFSSHLPCCILTQPCLYFFYPLTLLFSYCFF